MKAVVVAFALICSALAIDVGLPYGTRIIGGTPVPSGALPWQVILKKYPTDYLLCGGSVIAPNWVLTAGHCTYGLSSVFLIFGTINLNDYTISQTSTQIFLHPKYNPANLNNDVSLIQLSSPLTYSNTIQPISLVSTSQSGNTFLGALAVVAGYGYTDDEDLEFSNILLTASVNIINNSVCSTEFGSAIVIDSTMCAEGVDGSNQSICSGDSGGPLITKNSTGEFIQIGINSFVAQDACTEFYPSGYARLTSFLPFIESTTGLNLN